MIPDWLWIPITVWAAFAQTVRNAAQRHLTTEVGTLGATLVRFLYGVPFAALWLIVVLSWTGAALPSPPAVFWGWVLLGALTQIGGMGLLLYTMQQRNFALGVAYAKTEVLQVAIFGLLLLGDRITLPLALAVGTGTLGVLLLAPTDKARPIRAIATAWTSRPALLGLASGAGFALSAVGYRGAALSLGDVNFALAAAHTLCSSMLVQTLILGGWLAVRDRAVLGKVARAWRVSIFAGFMGAAASAGWFTAFAIQSVGYVRTLGLVELFFSLAVSRKLFGERHTRTELAGIALLALGVALVTLG